jgi:hypothetical protein
MYPEDDRGFIAGRAGFFLRRNVPIDSGAHTVSYTMGTGVVSSEAKRLGRETNHSPPSSAEIKNAWSYTSTPRTSARRGS